MKAIVRGLAGQAAQTAVRRNTGDGALLDPRRGWALLRDRDVPVAPKLTAVGLGVALTALLVALEIPLETVLGLFVPFFGMAADVLTDGLEMVIGPVLFATVLLPHLMPKKVVVTQEAPQNRVLPSNYTRR